MATNAVLRRAALTTGSKVPAPSAASSLLLSSATRRLAGPAFSTHTSSQLKTCVEHMSNSGPITRLQNIQQRSLMTRASNGNIYTSSSSAMLSHELSALNISSATTKNFPTKNDQQRRSFAKKSKGPPPTEAEIIRLKERIEADDPNDTPLTEDPDYAHLDAEDGGPILPGGYRPSDLPARDASNPIHTYSEPITEMSNPELGDPSTIPGWDLIHSPPRKLPRGALVGKVVSDKMSKTVNVAVDRYRMVPKLRVRRRYTRKFMAHDEDELCQMGDMVMIVPCQRISRHKHFMVREIIRAKGVL